jgi:hypothetical protein
MRGDSWQEGWGMSAPRSDWGKELKADVELVAAALEPLKPLPAEVKQLATESRELSRTVTELKTASGTTFDTLKTVDGRVDDLLGYKATWDAMAKLFYALLAISAAVLLAVGTGAISLYSSVTRQSEQISNLVKSLEKLEKVTADNAASTKSVADSFNTTATALKQSADENTKATRQLAQDTAKRLEAIVKASSPRQEQTARVYLTKTNVQTQTPPSKIDLLFKVDLVRPVDKAKVPGAVVVARLAPATGPEAPPPPGLTDSDLQLTARLADDGKSCFIELTTLHAESIARALEQPNARIPVDLLIQLVTN